MPSRDPATVVAFEECLARLTTAAYDVALRHGTQGPFLEVELDMWQALRDVLHEECPATTEMSTGSSLG